MLKPIRLFITLLVALLAITAYPTRAHALTSWCYGYSVSDSFENGVPWSLWNNSTTGTATLVQPYAPYHGYNALKLAFATGEVSRHFIAEDRVFDAAIWDYTWINMQNSYCVGHHDSPPPVPSGNPRQCTASVQVRTTEGATGLIELFDSSTYEILAQKNFTYPPQGDVWVNVITPLSNTCRQSMTARIELDRTPSSKSVMFDYVTVSYYY